LKAAKSKMAVCCPPKARQTSGYRHEKSLMFQI
jgi:hypothetical protein